MTNRNSSLPTLPNALLVAREKADAAHESAREAWELMGLKDAYSHSEITPWVQAVERAQIAQNAFEEQMDQWRKLANLT